MTSESAFTDVAYKINQGIVELSKIYDEVDVSLTDPVYSIRIFNWFNTLGTFIPALTKLTSTRTDIARAIDLCRTFGNTQIGRNYSSYVTVSLSTDPDSNADLATSANIAAQSASNVVSNAGIITQDDLKTLSTNKPGYEDYTYDAKIDTVFDKYDWLAESSLHNRFVSTSKYLTQKSAKLSNTNSSAYFTWASSYRTIANVPTMDSTGATIVNNIPTVISPRLNSWLLDDCTGIALGINNENFIVMDDRVSCVSLNPANINAIITRAIATTKTDGYCTFKARFYKKTLIMGQTAAFATTPFFAIHTTTYISNKSIGSVTRGLTVGLAAGATVPYVKVNTLASGAAVVLNYYGKVSEDNLMYTTMEFTVGFAAGDIISMVITNPVGGDQLLTFTISQFQFQSAVSSNPPALMAYIGDATFDQVDLLNKDNEVVSLFKLCELYHQYRIVRQLPVTGTNLGVAGVFPTIGLDFVLYDLVAAGVPGINLTRNILANTFYRYSFLFNWGWWLTNVTYGDRNLFINAYDRFIRYLCKNVITYALQDVDFRLWVRGSNFY